MKLLTFFLLALWSTSVVASSDSSQSRRVLVTDLEDDQAWPTGTPVYYEYKGDWYAGTITRYFNGVYSITWEESGEVEYFDDSDTVDTMVQNAKNNEDPTTYNVGTVVYRYFSTEKKFHHGEIIQYSNGFYKVKWSNGVVEDYPAGAEIDALVQAAEDASSTTATATTAAPTEAVVRETTATQASGSGTPPPTEEDTGTIAPTEDSTSDATVDVTMQGSFEVGTKVYKYFEGDGYYWGTITWYSDGVYQVTWQDNSKEKYDNLQEVIEMVERASRQNEGDAKESDPWENGTAVFKTFSDGDYFGEIILYQDGNYKIRWSDGDIESYSIAQTDLMVKAAYDKVNEAKAQATETSSEAATSTKKGLDGGAKFLIVVIVFAVVILVACCIRMRRTRNVKKSKSLDYTSSDDNLAPPPTYTDEPDAGAPLPDVI